MRDLMTGKKVQVEESEKLELDLFASRGAGWRESIVYASDLDQSKCTAYSAKAHDPKRYNELSLIETATGKSVPLGVVDDFVFSSDCRYLLMDMGGEPDNTVLREVFTGIETTLGPREEWKFSPDNRFLALLEWDNGLKLIELKTRKITP